MALEPGPKSSPLSQPITRDGHTVQVAIYEGDDTKWILEVVDEFGNSTVWNDQFDTDRAALDEVHKTIAEEGIESLVGHAKRA
jgi:hypothetical protein